MTRTFGGKVLLLGCAGLAVVAGCKDEATNPDTDMGVSDTGVDLGGPADTGVDLGPPDTGVDLGPPPVVLLRLAHFGYGSTFGAVHICVDDGAGFQTLITTDALAPDPNDPTPPTFQRPENPVPIPSFAITKHVAVPAQLAAGLLVPGYTVKFYRASEAGATITPISATVASGSCTPTGAALASIVIGTGAGQLNLVPNQPATIAMVGASGPEFTGATAQPPPALVVLADESVNTSTTSARARVVLADARYGLSPGLCQDMYMNPSPAPSAVGTGVYAFGGATSVYQDIAPIVPTIIPDADGGMPTIIPQLLTLHAAGDTTTPCAVNGGLPNGGVVPVGTIPPSPDITAAFAANPGGAVIAQALVPQSVTTIFVAPVPLTYADVSQMPPVGCTQGSSATCLPVGFCNPADLTYCALTSIALPVDDAL